MKTLTIFTPTYNRAYCLDRLYKSLKSQTSKDFEWLIINDGSTDETESLVKLWKKEESEFKIHYIYKENGGMHTAYNLAYQNIKTELSMNVDSDDYLPEDSVELIVSFWNQNHKDDIGGIYALDQFPDGSIIGTPFPDDLTEFSGWGYKTIYYTSNGLKKKYKNRGDKKFIGVTRWINSYPPIPVFDGEKYRSLYYKQHLIERDSRVLILNQPVCIVEYQADGSSATMWTQYLKNPKGFCDERKYNIANSPSAVMKFKEAIHYVAESKLAGNKRYVFNSPNRWITATAAPLGIILYQIILRKAKS